MKHSDPLFTLIKGLSRNEKGYFKRHALTHGKTESNYLRLFEALDAQAQYDEPALRNQFRGEVFMKQFGVTRNYLYHLVLKSMEVYRQAGSPDAQVRSLLNRAEFLYEKALYRQCSQLLQKVKAMTAVYEMYYFRLEALRLERQLATRAFDFEKRKRHSEEEAKTLEILKKEKQVQDLYDRVTTLFYLGGREKKDIEAVRKLVQHPAFRSDKAAPSFLARRSRLECLTYYNVLTENRVRIHDYAVRTGQLYLSKPEMIRYNIHGYLNTLNTILYSCTALRRISGIQYWLGQLRDSEKFIRTRTHAAYHFWLQYHVLHYNHLRGDFETAVKFCRSHFFKYLDTYRDELSPRVLFIVYMNIAKSYFGTGHFSAALAWLNKVNNELRLSTDPEAQCFERLFYLIVHFELKHYDLMPYLIKSAYRFLSKMERLQPFQKAWIGFLQQFLRKEFSPKQLKQAFISFRNRLEKEHRQALESQSVEFFDYIAWLNSKIENRPFAEVVQEKARSFN